MTRTQNQIASQAINDSLDKTTRYYSTVSAAAISIINYGQIPLGSLNITRLVRWCRTQTRCNV